MANQNLIVVLHWSETESHGEIRMLQVDSRTQLTGLALDLRPWHRPTISLHPQAMTEAQDPPSCQH